jgi:hypothetical protein
MSDYIKPVASDLTVQQSFIYAQLALRGEDTNQIGTELSVAISAEFDRWLNEERRLAWQDGAYWVADKNNINDSSKMDEIDEANPYPYAFREREN